ncbi:hypothetical protein SVIOM342S_00746 [Streptomyces violaceorubidus]
MVVVALNGGPEAAAVTALTAAHSRAGALLIVCGDPQRINSVLGAGVLVRSDGCGARRYDPGASVRSPCTEAGLGVPGHAGDVVP